MMRPEQLRAFEIEETKFVVARLWDVIRNPRATKEEVRIAETMLAHYSVRLPQS